MIPHKQQYTAGAPSWDAMVASDAIPGDCIRASVAALLDVEQIDLVPHFALFGNRWGMALIGWLTEQGKVLRAFSDDANDVEYWKYWGVEVFPLNAAPSGQVMIASGPSKNGPWSHVVVWKGSELVHDPSPTSQGLAGPPKEFLTITDYSAKVAA